MATEERGIVSRRAFAARFVAQSPDATDELADGLEQAFAGLAQGFRRLRQENLALRQENLALRAALNECVEACGLYLAPVLAHETDDADDPDHTRARRALDDARSVLGSSLLE